MHRSYGVGGPLPPFLLDADRSGFIYDEKTNWARLKKTNPDALQSQLQVAVEEGPFEDALHAELGRGGWRGDGRDSSPPNVQMAEAFGDGGARALDEANASSWRRMTGADVDAYADRLRSRRPGKLRRPKPAHAERVSAACCACDAVSPLMGEHVPPHWVNLGVREDTGAQVYLCGECRDFVNKLR
jgi:hypothetical protein